MSISKFGNFTIYFFDLRDNLHVWHFYKKLYQYHFLLFVHEFFRQIVMYFSNFGHLTNILIILIENGFKKQFLPTMTSFPLSMLACLLAAHSSILSLGQPESTALAMPPMASISSIIFRPSS